MREKVLTVVIPCLDEQETLPAFIKNIINVQSQLPSINIELLLVNDGSKDQTLPLMRDLVATYPNSVEYLSFSRNFGKEAAIYAGLQHAKGEWVAIMDADLQDPPQLLVDMYQVLQDPEVDVVAARRSSREGEPALRSFFARRFYQIYNAICEVQLKQGVRDFRMMRREVAQAVVSLKEVNRFTKGLFSWVGFNVAVIDYPNIQRVAGQTSWSFRKLWDYAIEGLTSFSTLPLTLATASGFILVVFAIVVSILQVMGNNPLTGGLLTNQALLILLLLIGGLQLICLGVIGKYIGKIYLEVKQRPLFIIKEKHLFEDSQPNEDHEGLPYRQIDA